MNIVNKNKKAAANATGSRFLIWDGMLLLGMIVKFLGKIKDGVRCVEKGAFFIHGTQRFSVLYGFKFLGCQVDRCGRVYLPYRGRC